MKFSKYIALLIILTFSTQFLHSEEKTRDIATSFKLSKSVVSLPYAPAIIYDRTLEYSNRGDLVNGTFGFAFDLLYRSKRRTYYNFALEYNFISLNDGQLSKLTGEELSVSYASVQIGGVYFVRMPDEFTPYFGYGVDIMFFTSNQDKVFEYTGSNNDRTTQVDFFGDVNVALLLKAGLSYPIDPEFTIFAEIDARVTSSEYLGLLTKLNLGASYWIQ